MAYTWLNRGVLYIVSSCGTTIRHEKLYTSRFEDDYGNVTEKDLPRPTVAHVLYKFLPLIDEHNKSGKMCWRSRDNGSRRIVGFAFSQRLSACLLLTSIGGIGTTEMARRHLLCFWTMVMMTLALKR